MIKKPGKVKAALLEWLGIPIGLSDSSFWTNLSSTVSAGQTVNDQTILQLSAVWSCVRLISETISTLPLTVYEKTSNGRIPSSIPLNNLIHSKPNNDSVASVFWESMLAAMLLRGNGFAEKRIISGRLIALNFLDPNRLTVQGQFDGKIKYFYTENGKQREIPENLIFRIPGFTTNGKWGLSVVAYGAGVFGSALAASNAANNTFDNGLSPTVAFKIDRVIKPEQREQFREGMAAISGAINAGKSPVLEAGMDVTTIGINPKDAQLLESRSFSVEEICRWFRVPPHMIGHAEKSTSWGTGIEQQMIGFIQFTLRPWLTRIEQYINKDLMTPVEQTRYYAEYNLEGLLRGDSAARREFYASALQNGWMNRNQVANLENQPAVPGGDIYTVQSNLIPIDKLSSFIEGKTNETTTTI